MIEKSSSTRSTPKSTSSSSTQKDSAPKSSAPKSSSSTSAPAPVKDKFEAPKATPSAATPATAKTTTDAKTTTPAGATTPATGTAGTAGTTGTTGATGATAAGGATQPPKIPPEVDAQLTDAEKQQLDRVLSGDRGAQATQDLSDITNAQGFEDLPVETQTRVVQEFLAHPTAHNTNVQLKEVASAPNFQSMTAEQQGQVLDVFKASDTTGRQNLIDLTNRTMPITTDTVCTTGSALLDKDKDGNTLLSSLHKLATEPLSPELAQNGVTRQSLLGSIMDECAHPGNVNQSNRGTCTVTTMQYMLCEQNPAEYGRIMHGLLTDGSVTLRNGDTLTREADSIAPDTAVSRSASERIFQSAMMEYANGSENYSNLDDRSRGKRLIFFNYDHGGLYDKQAERGLEALFGRDFDRTGDVLDTVRDRSPADTYVHMAWGEDKGGGHAVVVTRVENGRVYFRNPWGPTTDAAGTNYQDPPRRLEDPSTREESMSIEDFEKWARTAIE